MRTQTPKQRAEVIARNMLAFMKEAGIEKTSKPIDQWMDMIADGKPMPQKPPKKNPSARARRGGAKQGR